jgi:hypothetical protein
MVGFLKFLDALYIDIKMTLCCGGSVFMKLNLLSTSNESIALFRCGVFIFRLLPPLHIQPIGVIAL